MKSYVSWKFYDFLLSLKFCDHDFILSLKFQFGPNFFFEASHDIKCQIVTFS